MEQVCAYWKADVYHKVDINGATDGVEISAKSRETYSAVSSKKTGIKNNRLCKHYGLNTYDRPCKHDGEQKMGYSIWVCFQDNTKIDFCIFPKSNLCVFEIWSAMETWRRGKCIWKLCLFDASDNKNQNNEKL